MEHSNHQPRPSSSSAPSFRGATIPVCEGVAPWHSQGRHVMATQWNVYESFQAMLQAGPYHLALEGVLVLCVLWLFTAKKQPSKAIRLTSKEEEDLLSEWVPEPLVPSPPRPDHPALHTRTIHGRPGKHLTLGEGEGQRRLLNLGTHSYLDLGERPEVEEAALQCLHKYGVGSCGPRGFYGTTEVHLQLEERLARFFGTEAAVLYAYGFSTSASAIPAYAKSGDIIYADEMVNFAVQRGLQASRSRIVYFPHNDTDTLARLLDDQLILDKKDPKRANATRKFVVVEGVYLNTGRLCPLPALVAIRQKYKLRLFVDETVSFGTMGPNGRGITDHFSVPLKEVDLLVGSLEGAAGGSGGFCVGTDFVVEHQRLSGLGYCFSASLPPMLAAASIKVVELLEEEGGALVECLQDRCRLLHQHLTSGLPPSVELEGEEISPVKHLRLARQDTREGEELLRRVVQEAEGRGVALTLASYLRDKEAQPPPPSIRLTVHKDLTTEDIESATQAICGAIEEVLG